MSNGKGAHSTFDGGRGGQDIAVDGMLVIGHAPYSLFQPR